MPTLNLIQSDPSFVSFITRLESERPAMFKHADVGDIVSAYTGYLSSYDLQDAMKGVS